MRRGPDRCRAGSAARPRWRWPGARTYRYRRQSQQRRTREVATPRRRRPVSVPRQRGFGRCASRRRDRVNDAGVCWQGEHSWGCDRSGDVDDDIVGVIPCGCGRVRGRACLDGRGAAFCSLGGRLGEGLGVLACRCVPPHSHGRNQDDHEDQRGHGRPSGQETGDARLGGFILVRQGAVIHGFRQRRHAPMSQPS